MAKQPSKPSQPDAEPETQPVAHVDTIASTDYGNGTLIYDTTRPDGDTVNVVVNGIEHTSQPVSNGQFWLVTGTGFASFTAHISN